MRSARLLHGSGVRAVCGACLVLAASGCRSRERPQDTAGGSRPHATLGNQGTIRIRPLDVTFRAWPTNLANRLSKGPIVVIVDRAALDALAPREGQRFGEWATEFAHVAEAILPMRDCVAQLSDEKFPGAQIGDLQVRVYVTTLSPQRLRERVVTSGRATAARFFAPVVADSLTHGMWTKTTLRWHAFYTDYGGDAMMEYDVRVFAGQTIAVLSMHSVSNGAQEFEREWLLASFDASRGQP